jgi:hypothetical protein
MMSPLRSILVGLLFVLMTAFALRTGLRTGIVHLRGRGRVERRKHPVMYWSSITATAIICAGGVAMIVWGLIGGAGWR